MNFDNDFLDGLVLAALLAAHTPFIVSANCCKVALECRHLYRSNATLVVIYCRQIVWFHRTRMCFSAFRYMHRGPKGAITPIMLNVVEIFGTEFHCNTFINTHRA